MPNSTGGSFIPKRSTGKVKPSRSSRRIYVFSYIAYTFFFGTLLSVAGVFLLDRQAESRLLNYSNQLAEKQKEFSPTDIDRVTNLNARLTTALDLVERHLAPSRIFTDLEASTLTSVQLTELTYLNEEENVEVTFIGDTDTFDALVFQRDVIQESEVLASADVVEVAYGSESIEAVGNSPRSQLPGSETEAVITFTFTGDSLEESISYDPNIQLSPSAADLPTTPTSTSTPTETEDNDDVN